MHRHLLPSFLALLASLPAIGRADDCVGRSVEHVRAEGAPRLAVAWNPADERWELRDGSEVHPLSAIPEHAHLAVLVARGGTVAIVRTSAGHDLDDRVLVYRRDGHLMARHDLDDLLSPAAVRTLGRSISHIEWVRGWRFVGPSTIELRPTTGPAVRVELAP